MQWLRAREDFGKIFFCFWAAGFRVSLVYLTLPNNERFDTITEIHSITFSVRVERGCLTACNNCYSIPLFCDGVRAFVCFLTQDKQFWEPITKMHLLALICLACASIIPSLCCLGFGIRTIVTHIKSNYHVLKRNLFIVFTIHTC